MFHIKRVRKVESMSGIMKLPDDVGRQKCEFDGRSGCFAAGLSDARSAR